MARTHDIEWFKKWEEEKRRKAEAEKAKASVLSLDSEEKKESKPFEEEGYIPPAADINIKSGGKNSTYFKFHVNKNSSENPHYFMCEELLVPRANSADTQRLNMFSNHINQLVHLKVPEYPKVFTNFENQVGEYSIAYKKAQDDFKVIKKIVKNEYNYDLIIQYKRTGKYDIIHYNTARNITEDYGYKLNDCLGDVEEGESISEGTYLYKSDNYDDDGNFGYGVNLKAVYCPWKGLTYEDGVVISKSAAEKLTAYKVEKTIISVNENDIMLNLYGNADKYKSIPKVGDHIDSRVLVASRRRDKRTVMFDYQAGNISKLDPASDTIIYTGGGTVVDINIYNNVSLAVLAKRTDSFSKEIIEILQDQYRYWKEMREALEKIIPCKVLSEKEIEDEKEAFGHVCRHPIPKEENPNSYTDEIDYYWKLAHENTDERIQWRSDGKVFSNMKIEFTILKEDPLTEGCKITGRYGNKGVVTLIENDEDMPINEYGERAEIILNPLGVLNRLNPAQLQEVYLNFMADHVVREMKRMDNYDDKQDLFLSFLKAVNKKEYDFYDIELLMMNRTAKEEMIDEIERNGIYIHEPPFYGNTDEKMFQKIYEEHPEWCTEYKFEGIEKPMTMGDIYIIRLKHQASNKSSMRSATSLNTKMLPAKSLSKKEKKSLYSTTPIRLGEMEITGLMMSKRPDIVEKLLKTYATNETLRESTISQLLDPPIGKDPLDMNIEVDLSEKSISREILEKYLNVIGYTIIDNTDE